MSRVPAADPTAGSAGRLAGMVSAGRVSGSVVGIGIDAVDIDRLRAVLVRRRHLEERLFTRGERAYAHQAADPVPRLLPASPPRRQS